MEQMSTLTMRVRLIIPSSYFALSKIIDLNLWVIFCIARFNCNVFNAYFYWSKQKAALHYTSSQENTGNNSNRRKATGIRLGDHCSRWFTTRVFCSQKSPRWCESHSWSTRLYSFLSFFSFVLDAANGIVIKIRLSFILTPRSRMSS